MEHGLSCNIYVLQLWSVHPSDMGFSYASALYWRFVTERFITYSENEHLYVYVKEKDPCPSQLGFIHCTQTCKVTKATNYLSMLWDSDRWSWGASHSRALQTPPPQINSPLLSRPPYPDRHILHGLILQDSPPFSPLFCRRGDCFHLINSWTDVDAEH